MFLRRGLPAVEPDRARVAAGEFVVVFGCGGVGLAAVLVVAVSRGARVVAVTFRPRPCSWPGRSARSRSSTRARTTRMRPSAQATGGGSTRGHRSPRPEVCCGRASRASGRAGAMCRWACSPARTPIRSVDVGRIIAPRAGAAQAAHGMSAHEYPAMLDEIARGALDPSALVGRTIALDAAPAALAAMSLPAGVRRHPP